MIDPNQNQNVQNAIAFNPSNPSQVIKDALQVPSVPSNPTENKPSVPFTLTTRHATSGKFVANAIISKTYTNKEGELKGGNEVGFQVNFSNLEILDEKQREEIREKNKSALFPWEAFETIASSVPNFSPSNLGKAFNDLLAEDFGKIPKSNALGDCTKKLSVNVKNRMINGFYCSINALKHVIEMKCKMIEDEEGLVPTGFIVKNNGESKRTYQKMRKTTQSKGVVKSSKQNQIDQLQADNDRLMARLDAMEKLQNEQTFQNVKDKLKG